MRIDILTLFPDMCESVLSQSIIGRARAAEKVSIFCHNIRDYSTNIHKKVDDMPYGGGHGMVLQAEPIYLCFKAVEAQIGTKPHTIFLTAQGQRYTQQRCKELARLENILLVCGRYEGIDQRVIDELCDEQVSIGDYVITGGELAAMVLCDSVARLCEGVLSDKSGYENESHYSGTLEHPQYTRPQVWRGTEVPSVLVSGHHRNIERWKEENSVKIEQE